MDVAIGFRRTLLLAAVALVVLVFDQASKAIVVEFVMQPPREIPLAGFFNLVLSYNAGVSFGMMADQFRDNAAALGMVQAMIALAIMVFALRIPRRIDAIALAMLAGGAASNAADRLHRGTVVDFLDFHAAGIHWPAFNFADAAIVAGAIIFAASGIPGVRHSHKTKVNGS